MKKDSFIWHAYNILKQTKKTHGMHVKDITNQAIKDGLYTKGKTPVLTMNAVIIRHIKQHKKPLFKKVGPSTYALNKTITDTTQYAQLLADERTAPCAKGLSTRQKGDIAEARVNELIMVHGNESLATYKPISDDEGIDLIVKNKKSGQNVFIQVKSVWSKRQSYVASVKNQPSLHHNKTFVVFVLFDTSICDMWDYVWLVPGKEIVRNGNLNNNNNRYAFVAGFNVNANNTWNDYLFKKEELANEIEKIINNRFGK